MQMNKDLLLLIEREIKKISLIVSLALIVLSLLLSNSTGSKYLRVDFAIYSQIFSLLNITSWSYLVNYFILKTNKTNLLFFFVTKLIAINMFLYLVIFRNKIGLLSLALGFIAHLILLLISLAIKAVNAEKSEIFSDKAF